MRSGRLAANSAAIAAASETPNTSARSDPAASSTRRRSSIRSSSVGAPTTGSEAPLPRRSKRITRAKPASRSKKRAQRGSSKITSTQEIQFGTQRRSCGPSPSVRQAMWRSPSVA